MATPAYSDALVQRVNELYHDLDHDTYDHTHPEILHDQPERWRRLARQHLPLHRPLELVDVGTGTGFVPLTIGTLLGAQHHFRLMDISSAMLEAARAAVSGRGFVCRFTFQKLEAATPLRMPFENASLDVVTMNSVLHHIRDTVNFLGEAHRILRPGGLFFIGHEPNARFHRNLAVSASAAVATRLLSPKQLAYEALRVVKLDSLGKRVYYRFRPQQRGRLSRLEEIAAIINEKLLAEGLLREPLRADEIGRVTDVLLEGFDPERLSPLFEVVVCETYHHLDRAIVEGRSIKLLQRWDAWLRRLYPNDGRDFFVVLRKPGAAGPQAVQ